MRLQFPGREVTVAGGPAPNEMRVAGVLDGRGAAWFDGLEVSDQRDEAVIFGLLPDRPRCTSCWPGSATTGSPRCRFVGSIPAAGKTPLGSADPGIGMTGFAGRPGGRLARLNGAPHSPASRWLEGANDAVARSEAGHGRDRGQEDGGGAHPRNGHE